MIQMLLLRKLVSFLINFTLKEIRTVTLLLLNIESSRNSPVPVKKGGVGNWVYDTAFFASKVTGVTGLDDVYISRKIGSTPSVTGETISDSNAFPCLELAGVMGSIYGDERGGRIA